MQKDAVNLPFESGDINTMDAALNSDSLALSIDSVGLAHGTIFGNTENTAGDLKKRVSTQCLLLVHICK